MHTMGGEHDRRGVGVRDGGRGSSSCSGSGHRDRNIIIVIIVIIVEGDLLSQKW